MIVLRSILGLLFIASAVLKLMSIDEFELFVFKWSQLGWNVSTLISRLLVVWEFFLGAALVLGIRSRLSAKLSVATLVGFTLLLGALVVLGENENCQCFGKYVDLDPKESIVKNILLFIGFAVLLRFSKTNSTRFRVWYWPLLVVSFITVAVVSPPDFLLNNRYDPTGVKMDIDRVALEKAIVYQKTGVAFDTAYSGKQILMFISHSCSMCKKSAMKMAAIQLREEKSLPVSLFIMGTDTTKYEAFMQETKIDGYPTYFMEGPSFLEYTKQLPTIFLVEDKKVVSSYGYRTFNERSVLDFIE
jgi:uncharacterized membrane protein YphA (DoxX/SURF4 family)